ncbi:MAG: substrate-binding domain-containing protein [Proteobacteria bacterium]|nr:substrate-binding domain-containing protein [Pseudomonadota bacterium]
MNRRSFLKSGSLALGIGLSSGNQAFAEDNKNKSLQVWSCGGLAEAFIPANQVFETKTGASVSYTGAFAGALGKSLLGGNATTEVFAPRVLELAKKLKAQGKMLSFEPLCFTRYVLATPKGNPAHIESIDDMGREGVRTVLIPDASPPGGQASMIILKKAGVEDLALKNAVKKGDCVQTALTDLIEGKGDVAVVEQRITRLPQFAGKLDVRPIPEQFIPPVPVPFTIGVMTWAKNRDLAREFVTFILSDQGQAFFERAGFIPARSEEGERLIQKYGVLDA